MRSICAAYIWRASRPPSSFWRLLGRDNRGGVRVMMRSTYVGIGTTARETDMEKPILRWDVDVPGPTDEPGTDVEKSQPSHFGLRVLEQREKTEEAVLISR